MRIPLVGGGNLTRSVVESAETLINLYGEVIEDPDEHEKNNAVLYGMPGRHVFKDMTAIDAGFAHLRGIFSIGGRCFVAGGNGNGTTDGRYCEVSSTGTLIGSVRTISNAPVNGLSNSPVQFYPNGNQLLIVGGGVAYIDNGSGPVAITFTSLSGTVDTAVAGPFYRATWVSGDKFTADMQGGTITINAVTYTVLAFFNDTTLELQTSAGTQSGVAYSFTPTATASTGFFQDDYYGITRPDSRQYNISAVNDATGSVWNGLDFGTKDSYPDYLRTVLSSNDLFLFGVESTDVHRNTGKASFPFENMSGANFRIGTSSPWSPISINNQIFFMGTNSQGRLIAYTLNGYKPVRVSTHAQEYQWAAANLGANCISYQAIYEGHAWWITNFGTQTWVYDITSSQLAGRPVWSQRFDGTAASPTAFPIQFHTFVPEFGNGKHLVCGNANGTVYEESLDFYDIDGADMWWERTLPHAYTDSKQRFFGRMTLEMETGTSASGTPVVTRYYSDDRGHTFSNAQTASIGSVGQFSLRVFWPGTSMSRDRVWRLRGSGQYKIALIALDEDSKPGRA